MAFREYGDHDATGLAELVRTKAVHPRELVDEAITRIERDNPRLNAVIHPMFESARREAETPVRGPFGGVPFLIKDLLTAWKGEPQCSGSRALTGWISPHDSEVAARYRHSGVIVVGKTNTPELGVVPVTEPAAFGPTRNPWDTNRTPGGSSGGSGAAVAAGFVPMAGGGDGGGSIRIPSSCCGLFGLKPTRGRVPMGPDLGEAWQGCVVEHVLTRSVRDSAAMLDAIHGPDDGAPYYAPAPARRFLEEVLAAPGRLKIAYTTRAIIPADVHAECAAATDRTVAILRELGHDLVEAHPPIDGEQLGTDFVTMIIGEVAAEVAEIEARLGRAVRRGELERETAMLNRLGHAVPAVDFALASRRLHAIGRQTAEFFRTFDLLLTPTLAQPPLLIGSLAPKGADAALLAIAERLPIAKLLRRAGGVERIAAKAWGFTPFTAAWNATGQPACSVPMHWTVEGLPIGVQLVGRYGDEATLFRVAGQLERAQPWRDRRAPGA